MAVVINTTTNKNRLKQNVKAFVAERAKAWNLTGYTLTIVQRFADPGKLSPGDKMGINSAVDSAIDYYHKTWINVKTDSAEEQRIMTEIVVEYLFSNGWNPAFNIAQRAKLVTEGRGIRNRVDEYAAKVHAVKYHRA